ncbi:5'-nucleotidase [Psychromicrobium silvestre]|uniref:5'-nucleotidase n=1 Tax=Psychromicrobium silvestre TaxID=1645614 RepID=A0A7Y9LUC4_9MICC|nr:ExeM/NucH family extracellular endonuclease [Psychromicrobium silvestre]NYE95783.1 5'-nucleotidase [Psychromicrobium silvestre]
MPGKSIRVALGGVLAAAFIAAPLASAPALAASQPQAPTATTASPVVINEAYLSGGSAGAAYKNKFIELYNATDASVSLDGWSLQYRSATGTANPAGIAPLSGSIPAKGHFLVQASSNGTSGADLPTPDATSTLNFSGTSGTIYLAKKAAAVTGLATGSVTDNADVADLLGYGTSNTFETAAATAPSGNTDVKSLNRTDGADSNNNSADFKLSASITPQSAGSPVDPGPVNPTIAAIKDIQGSTDTSPLVNQTVTTRGVVTAVYPTGGFNGYYIQTEGTGGDLDLSTHKASDAVFVYSPSTMSQVQAGDFVEVTGPVTEFKGASDATSLTEISVAADKLTKLSQAAVAVKPAVVDLPATAAERESLEGMLFQPKGSYTVADNYSLNQYGEIGLAAGTTPLVQPNALYPYGSAENTALVASNAAKSIGLDDGASTNFLSAANQGTPLPYLTTASSLRVGAAVTFSTNVIFDNRNGDYKLQPLTQLTPANAASVQPASFSDTRSAPAAVGGNLKIASFNVQNYFIHTGDQDPACTAYSDRAGNKITVKGGCTQRGAWDAANLQRQQDKVVAGIIGTGADVLSLEEIENSAKFADSATDRDKALKTLVDALNAKLGSNVWDYVRSPQARPAVSDEDVIRTAFIFKTAAAEPVGDSVILNDAAFTGIARQPLAQSFKPKGAADSAQFLAIVNHFKSKGSAPANDPSDTDKGQGNSNNARVKQAQALLTFANTLKAQKNTTKVLLIGDFNAYSKEDPINTLTAAGYTDLDPQTGKHSYLFDGRVGSLDHVLVSNEFAASITGADIWNINSVESVALNYSRYNYNVTDYYNTEPYAASDHDPVVVGLNLSTAPAGPLEVNLLNINDFHGRIDTNTVNFAGTVEQLKAASPAGASAFLSAGDNVSASLYASAVQKDQPTIDVLNAMGLQASAVGNHEFDSGFADLKDRIINGGTNAKWDYLGANVYLKGTTTPALDEYKLFTVNGVKIAVVGAVTQEAPTLVSPSGIAQVDFGDPVDAVNRVATKIKEQKLADVIVAEYHEGAAEGTPDGASLEQELNAPAGQNEAFKKIVNQTSSVVNAIFTGHTHKQYAWDAPIPGVAADAAVKTRPVLQTGDYGENIGQVQLYVDPASKQVLSYKQRNVPRTTTPAADLVSQFPVAAKVKGIVDAALAYAQAEGDKPIGKISADITTAQVLDPATGKYSRDDRQNESTLGNLVANALKSSLSDPSLGGAEIGVVNPGGLRADLLYKAAGAEGDGVVTVAEANAVLPFLNNLWTTSLTGAQFKTLLEQQWQTNADGTIPSRPFLNLGLSKNVDYTYDPSKPQGSHVTSIVINGAPIDPAKSYRIGTFSFLTSGGDNFRIFTEGTNAKDSGLVDRDAWFKYLSTESASKPIAPDFTRRALNVTGAPTSVTENQQVTVKLQKLDLTSLGTPASTKVTLRYEPSGVGGGTGWSVPTAAVPAVLGTFPVTAGVATLSFKVPAELKGGRFTVTTDTGTYGRLPIDIGTTAPPAPSTNWWTWFWKSLLWLWYSWQWVWQHGLHG